MHDNSQVIALSLGNSNRISQICDFQFSQICDLAFWTADYYHKFVKKSLFVVCGCMFLVKNINFLLSLNENIHIYFRTCYNYYYYFKTKNGNFQSLTWMYKE